MKNKILTTILITSITLPQITLASWWNPSSWFKGDQTESTTTNNAEIPSSVNLSNKKIDNNNIVTTPTIEPKVIEKTVVKTVPVDRIVEKIVPDQSVVNENNSLKKQIQDLQTTLKQRLDDISKLQAQIQILQGSQTAVEAKKKDLISQIANVDLEIAKTNNGYYDAQLCSSYPMDCDNHRSTAYPYGDTSVLHKRKIDELNVQKAQFQLELSKL